MNITAEAVKQLRERTGAGMMECKRALVETKGDLDAAAELMRKQGLAKDDNKAARVAAEGVVAMARSGKQRFHPVRASRSAAATSWRRSARTSAYGVLPCSPPPLIWGLMCTARGSARWWHSRAERRASPTIWPCT